MAEKNDSKTSSAKEVKKVPYQLVRDFWDNRIIREKGSVVYFEEGKAPRESKRLEPKEAKRLQGLVVAAALDPVENELAELRERLALLEGVDKIPAKK